MNDLIQKLESYNWTDELGHPLVNCQDWIDLKNLVHAQSGKSECHPPSSNWDNREMKDLFHRIDYDSEKGESKHIVQWIENNKKP